MPKTYININGDVRDASSLKIPTDRTFRSAWQFEGDAVEIDMPKARDIHRDNLRAERAPKLDALDIDYMKALEEADTKTQKSIVKDKKVLRKVTADYRLDSSATPKELQALTLDTLIK